LGHPVIEINVSDEQIDDRVDEALRFWYDYHGDGTERTYYKYIVTPTDITNRFIILPDNIIGAVQIFDPGIFQGADLLLNVRYQLIASDLLNVAGQTLVPYVMTMQNIALIQEILNGQIPIRYNRHTNKLFIDCDWSERFSANAYLIVDCYTVVDPEVYTKAYSDRMLQNYCIQLIKQNWGSNMKKFNGMALPGGVQMNGQQIFDEATAEITHLESEITNSYSLPSMLFIG
jgi:hypothetical protein